MSTPVDAPATREGRKKKKRAAAPGGPPEKVGGERDLHGTQCASAQGSGPFKPRRAGARVDTAHARSGLSAREAPGPLSNERSPPAPPLSESTTLGPRRPVTSDSASWEPSNRNGLPDWVLREICPIHWTGTSPYLETLRASQSLHPASTKISTSCCRHALLPFSLQTLTD